MSSISCVSQVEPCVTSSGNTVPPAVPECKASCEKLAGIFSREPFTSSAWIWFRLATSSSGVQLPWHLVAGPIDSIPIEVLPKRSMSTAE